MLHKMLPILMYVHSHNMHLNVQQFLIYLLLEIPDPGPSLSTESARVRRQMPSIPWLRWSIRFWMPATAVADKAAQACGELFIGQCLEPFPWTDCREDGKGAGRCRKVQMETPGFRLHLFDILVTAYDWEANHVLINDCSATFRMSFIFASTETNFLYCIFFSVLPVPTFPSNDISYVHPKVSQVIEEYFSLAALNS